MQFEACSLGYLRGVAAVCLPALSIYWQNALFQDACDTKKTYGLHW